MPAKPLSALAGMPQMHAAFAGWTIPITLTKIEQQVSSGFALNIKTDVAVMGTWQPLSPEQIALKPDGQRSWEWIDLHIEGKNVLFQTNDRIIKDDLTYKVMALRDYTLNNFCEYHLIRDYEGDVGPNPPSPAYVTYLGEVVTYNGEPVTYTAP